METLERGQLARSHAVTLPDHVRLANGIRRGPQPRIKLAPETIEQLPIMPAVRLASLIGPVIDSNVTGMMPPPTPLQLSSIECVAHAQFQETMREFLESQHVVMWTSLGTGNGPQKINTVGLGPLA